MSNRLTIKGQVTIPKAVRDKESEIFSLSVPIIINLRDEETSARVVLPRGAALRHQGMRPACASKFREYCSEVRCWLFLRRNCSGLPSSGRKRSDIG